MINLRIATAILFASSCAAAQAIEASSEGPAVPAQHNLDFVNLPGADEDARNGISPLGTGQYLFIAGSAFNARSSTQTVSYPGAGCTSSSDAVTTDVQLPSGTVVNGVRLYYYSNGASGNLGLFFTSYNGQGGLSDLVTGSSTVNTGYSSDYFAAGSPITIDNASNSYVVTVTMNPGQRFCGARVFLALP